jgi:hypothetical protein
MTFNEWLNDQTERNDPTGDLASDAREHLDLTDIESLPQLLEYAPEIAGLHRVLTSPIREALIAIWEEYERNP